MNKLLRVTNRILGWFAGFFADNPGVGCLLIGLVWLAVIFALNLLFVAFGGGIFLLLQRAFEQGL